MSVLPTPVDLNRVRNLLDHQNLRFDAHGSRGWSLAARNAHYLWTLQNPQVLQIRGQWRGIASTAAMFRDLRRVISRCNSTRTMPKAFTLPLDNGNVGLMTECNILTRAGLTEEQFFSFCEDSLGAIMDFFSDTEAELPEFVTWKEGP